MENKNSASEYLGHHFGDILRRLGRAAINLALPFAPDFVMNDAHKLTPEMLDKAFPSANVVVFDIEGTLENYKEPRVSDETRTLIKRLQDAGYVIAINSNAPDAKRTEMVHEMFDELLGEDLVITSYDAEKVGYKHGGKPHSSMLDLTEKRIQQNPSRQSWNRQNFIMVGDQLFKDVLAGKNANVKTLYVNKYGPDDHEMVARLQRGHEHRFMRSVGFKALQGVIGRYQPLDLPDEMTKVRDFRKQNFITTRVPDKSSNVVNTDETEEPSGY